MTPPSPPNEIQGWAKLLAQLAAIAAFVLKLAGIW